MTFSLTQADISRLIHEPSADIRCAIAEKMCLDYQSRRFTQREKEVAEDIFKLLLKDTEIRVRKTLAETLKDCPDAPHDVISSLADDASEISSLVLEYSPVLDDDELIQLCEATENIVKLVAVASRRYVSTPVSKTLIDKREPSVAKALINNETSQLDDECYASILTHFNNHSSVLEDMVYRGGLPYAYSEQLFVMVSSNLRKQLTKKYRFTWKQIDQKLEDAREASMLKFLSPWMSESDLIELVEHMHKNSRLTHSLIMRALCMGDLRFFETAMAKRVGIPTENAHILLSDIGDKGFDALYNKSGMPKRYRDPVRILYNLMQDEQSRGDFDTEELSVRLVTRIHEEGHDKSVVNMSYLLSMMGRSVADVDGFH
ncbi:MAG: DUF2336 domain-containing protein [Rickettsiales bacterium]|nr:DUF2336 domain-containing protein [Rickettsiales bacterium]